MQISLPLRIEAQPTDTTCGPSCLAAIYRFWKDDVSRAEAISAIDELPAGGTLAVGLAIDALQRGYHVRLTTFNVQLFDPTWFAHSQQPNFGDFLIDRLREQKDAKQHDGQVDWERLAYASNLYERFLQLGGDLQTASFNESLLTEPLQSGLPILCGLSATYLYQESRERPQANKPGLAVPDDVGGYPVGHFVVLHGYDSESGQIDVADPLHDHPLSDSHHYQLPVMQVMAALLLGVVTYDANLLTIYP